MTGEIFPRHSSAKVIYTDGLLAPREELYKPATLDVKDKAEKGDKAEKREELYEPGHLFVKADAEKGDEFEKRRELYPVQ